jgi:glutamyl-tRNA(Gln) amidotransferase subunit D
LSTPELEGYHGEILHHLKEAGARVGSLLRITSKTGELFEGYLIPRSEYADRHHILLKMRNGYNIGIHHERAEKIEILGQGEKPHFTKPHSAPKHPGLPRVSMISVGGTIASRVDYRTGAVQPALTAEDLTSVVPELNSIAEVEAHILYSELSENFTPTHWQGMAEETARRIREGADGVVIAHGTDTMHYTSAALSFALQNPPVPILLVGAQRSSDRPSSDAASNLAGAVGIAGRADLAAVGLAMHEELSDDSIVAHRGTRVRKCHTSRRDTFKSINSPPMARYRLSNGQIEILDKVAKRDKDRTIELKPHFSPHAYLFKSYPGFNPHLIDAALDQGARGIVLEGTGLGHIPKHSYQSVANAIKHEVPVFMTSQTIWGRVDMNVYSTGRDLTNIGVTSLDDMLSETAFVKLSWVLAQAKTPETIKQLMTTSIAGEITHRTLLETA